jgi:hypothetical protein
MGIENLVLPAVVAVTLLFMIVLGGAAWLTRD